MMDPKHYLHSIFIGQPKTITDERGTWTSSIFRDPVTGPVRAQKGGLLGDKVTQPYHGGEDGDICVHLMDHYRFWNERYGMSPAAGGVGENFTLENIREDEICAGDILRVGGALIQVSGPRTPCANQARRVGRADWVRLVIRENRTGFYMRVLEAGDVQPGDAWVLMERPNPEGQITALNRCMYLEFDAEYALRIQEMKGLGDWWKTQVMEKMAQQSAHWTATMKD